MVSGKTQTGRYCLPCYCSACNSVLSKQNASLPVLGSAEHACPPHCPFHSWLLSCLSSSVPLHSLLQPVLCPSSWDVISLSSSSIIPGFPYSCLCRPVAGLTGTSCLSSVWPGRPSAPFDICASPSALTLTSPVCHDCL